MGPRQRFQESWLSNELFREWIAKVPDDSTRAYCQICHKLMMAEISGLKYHRQSRKHVLLEEMWQEANRREPGPMSANAEGAQDTSPGERKKEEAVNYSTLLFILFLAEHNLPFSLYDDMIELHRKMFPDSAVAAHMTLSRRKCSDATKMLGKYIASKVASKLQKNKFSLIIDETSDSSTEKCCVLMAKYFDNEEKRVKTALLDIVSVYEGSEGSSGQSLFNIILKYLASYDIPITNMVGFAADGASNIMGDINTVSSRLRTQMPGISIFMCVAHSIQLCSSEAAKTLPRNCEELVRNIFSFFSHSTKRKYQFKEYQVFCSVKPHKLLHPCATMWLSLSQAVSRVIEQWASLKLFFNKIQIQEKLASVDHICEALDDKAVYCYLHFMNYILPHLNQMNVLFRTTAPTIHFAHNVISSLYRKLLNNFCLPKIIQTHKLNDIDPADSRVHLPVEQIYLGEQVNILFQKTEYQHKSLVNDIKIRCRTFLIVACQQIKCRFDLDKKLWVLASCLQPQVVMDPEQRRSIPSLSELAEEVPRISATYDLQALADQWREIAWDTFPEDLKVPKCDIEKFYKYVLEKRDAMGDCNYETFAKFALEVLALPMPQTDVERLFPKFNNIKKKERNDVKMLTVTSLIQLQEYSKNQNKDLTQELIFKLDML